MKLVRIALALAACALTAVALVAARQDSGMPKPGPEHKLLESWVGTWQASMTMAGMPEGAPPVAGSYVATREHAGMWIRGEFRADLPDMGPFSGTDISGYDSRKGKYVGVWFDSWSDYLMPFEGEYDPATKTLTHRVDGRDEAGNPRRARHETTLVDEDTRIFKMFQPDEQGELVQVMTIEYKRK